MVKRTIFLRTFNRKYNENLKTNQKAYFWALKNSYSRLIHSLKLMISLFCCVDVRVGVNISNKRRERKEEEIDHSYIHNISPDINIK